MLPLIGAVLLGTAVVTAVAKAFSDDDSSGSSASTGYDHEAAARREREARRDTARANARAQVHSFLAGHGISATDAEIATWIRSVEASSSAPPNPFADRFKRSPVMQQFERGVRDAAADIAELDRAEAQLDGWKATQA